MDDSRNQKLVSICNRLLDTEYSAGQLFGKNLRYEVARDFFNRALNFLHAPLPGFRGPKERNDFEILFCIKKALKYTLSLSYIDLKKPSQGTSIIIKAIIDEMICMNSILQEKEEADKKVRIYDSCRENLDSAKQEYNETIIKFENIDSQMELLSVQVEKEKRKIARKKLELGEEEVKRQKLQNELKNVHNIVEMLREKLSENYKDFLKNQNVVKLYHQNVQHLQEIQRSKIHLEMLSNANPNEDDKDYQIILQYFQELKASFENYHSVLRELAEKANKSTGELANNSSKVNETREILQGIMNANSSIRDELKKSKDKIGKFSCDVERLETNYTETIKSLELIDEKIQYYKDMIGDTASKTLTFSSFSFQHIL